MNHVVCQNGGTIAFSPADGFLYLGLGDGGSVDDPAELAQDPGSLLGKLLRLDVGVPPAPGSIPAGAYAIPADNPFVGDPNARVVMVIYLAQDSGFWRVLHLGFDQARRSIGD